ncbi:hypothetical protein ACTXT7_005162 [Hymenolepis weldensis]
MNGTCVIHIKQTPPLIGKLCNQPLSVFVKLIAPTQKSRATRNSYSRLRVCAHKETAKAVKTAGCLAMSSPIHPRDVW